MVQYCIATRNDESNTYKYLEVSGGKWNNIKNTHSKVLSQQLLTYECYLDIKVMINYRKHSPEVEKHHGKSQVD